MNLKINLVRLLLLPCCCLIIFPSVAQFDFGAVVGANASSFRNNPSSRNVITYQAGLVGVVSFGRFGIFELELQPQLVWQRKGAEVVESFLQGGINKEYSNLFLSNYIQLNCGIGGTWNFHSLQPFIYFSPYAAYRINSQNEWQPSDGGDVVPIYDPNNIDAGIKFSVGVGVRRVRFSVAYGLGLASMVKKSPYFYNNSFEVTFAYLFVMKERFIGSTSTVLPE